MLRFYGLLAIRAVEVFYKAADHLTTAISIGVFLFSFVILFNESAGKAIVSTWDGISPWWSLLPLGLLFLYGLARANYQQFQQLESRLTAAQSEITSQALINSQLQEKLDERERRKGAFAVLGKQLAEGVALRNEGMKIGARNSGKWNERVSAWQEATQAQIEFVSVSQAALFQTLNKFSPMTGMRDPGSVHSNRVAALDRRVEILQQLLASER